MTETTSETFLRKFCANSEQVSHEEIESGGALVLLKLEGFSHFYLDEPFDAYYVCLDHGDMKCGPEWFSTDELDQAEAAFQFRRANNPSKPYRGAIAFDIGAAVPKASTTAAAPAI
jgi:hypothetical protein